MQEGDSEGVFVSKNDVEAFLEQLKIKILVFDIIYLDRDKNMNTLLELGIVPKRRTEIIKTLSLENYVEGPRKDVNNESDLWIFGSVLYEQEIYIKLQLGLMNKPVLCVSFHLAEYRIAFPFVEN